MSEALRERQSAEAGRGNVEATTGQTPGRSTLAGADGLEGDGLPYRQKSLFESSLGRDLSDVRVHTGPAADQLAARHDARAFAVQNDIYFAGGEYNPGTKAGDALLAHEVAHTVQQSGSQSTGELAKTTPGDRAERNADGAAAAMLQGQAAEVSSEPVAIARRARNEAVVTPDLEPAVGGGERRPVVDGEAGGAGGGETEGGPAQEGDEEIGELTAERVGVEEEEGTEPVGPPQNLEGGKQELTARSKDTQGGDGGEAPGGDGPAPAGRGGGNAPEGATADGEGVVASPEIVEAIQAAQSDALEGQAEAEAESAAFDAEMKARREQFDAEQEAVIVEKLRAMSAAEKRSMLVEMGWDEKSVKKLKDHELDGIIEGKFAEEARRTKILGMTPEELAALSPDQKLQFLVDLGIDRKDLNKIGQAKACKAFDDIMRVAHVPGQHKVKIKIKGGFFNKKSWEVTIKVDADGNPEITAKKKKGFLSKLWGWVKALIPVILTLLGPITGGISLVVLAVYQTAIAIQTGDWLGAIIGIAGGLVAVGGVISLVNAANAAKGIAATATGFAKVASVAGKVKQLAQTAQTAMLAAKAKNPGSLLGALAQGAATFATFAANTASKFAETMTRWSERLKKWSQVVAGGEKVVRGVKTGDPLMAIGGAFETASAAVGGTSNTGKNLTRAANITSFVSVGQRALKANPPDYGAVAEAALGIAGQLRDDRRIDDAARIVSAANRLRTAWANRDADPAALAAAALDLAQAIQVAKYDADNTAPTDGDGNPVPDERREAIISRYTKATNIVRAAGSLIKAASAKPRPDYLAALDAATQLIANLTENERLDAAAVITSNLNAWTAAVRSKDDKAIIAAAIALGESINGMADLIKQDREAARREAEAQLGEGQTLPEEEVEDLPPFSRDIGDIAEGAPGVLPGDPVAIPGDGVTPGDDTTVDDGEGTTNPDPAGEVKPPADPNAGRRSTPGANYTVRSGDSLSAISAKTNIRLARLRELNPQLVNDLIYIGQRLVIPNAERLTQPASNPAPAPPTTVPPAAAGMTPEQDRAMVLERARSIVRTWRAQCADWLGQWFLGNSFYDEVRRFNIEVNSFAGAMNGMSTDAVRARIQYLNSRFGELHNIYTGRVDRNLAVIDWTIFALEIVRDGAGIALGMLDKTRITPALYQAAITAIDEGITKGGNATQVILRSTIAGVLEVIPGKDKVGVVQSAVTEGFRALGSTVNDFMADLSRKGDLMTAAEKRQLQAQYLVKIPTLALGGAVKGRLDALNHSAGASKITEALGNALYESFRKVTDKVISN